MPIDQDVLLQVLSSRVAGWPAHPVPVLRSVANSTGIINAVRIVEVDGTSNSSSIHPNIKQRGPRRQGNNYMMAGPLNSILLYKLADPVEGIILDSWLDADGNAQGELDL